jgi:isopenicillin-N epimerase
MPESSRREFVSCLLGGAAALGAPGWVRAATPLGDPGSRPGAWPGDFLSGPPELLDALLPWPGPAGGGAPDDEVYWARVKEQFPLAPGIILLNAANLCPSPYAVQEAVFEHTRDVDRDASFQNRERFEGLREESRAALASFVGAFPGEIAINRNTSEGNNTVVNGLDLGPGDEVVLWDQNHPTNNVAWDVRAQRWGFTVKRVSSPPGVGDPGELAEPFLRALTPRTRVLAFSHLSNVSGVLLPARELCEAARERGVLTLVDGAQTLGALELDLHDMGCDVFTASSHKWLMGPKEVGVMYVRAGVEDRIWPSNVGVGWEGAQGRGARKFDNLGQRDDGAVASMATAVAFHRALGPAAVEGRVRYLASRVVGAVEAAFPGVRMHTPGENGAPGGVVVFALPGADHQAAYRGVYRSHGVGCAAMGGEFQGIRLSPHVYNTLGEVETAMEALAANA